MVFLFCCSDKIAGSLEGSSPALLPASSVPREDGSPATAGGKLQNESGRKADFSLNESSIGILDLDAIQCKFLEVVQRKCLVLQTRLR